MTRRPPSDLGPLLEQFRAPAIAPSRASTSRAAYAREMNAHYDALEAKLVAAGWPPTSPWWRRQVRRFFSSPCRQFVPRVGRRGGKSSTFCRLAIVEVLHGRHDVPPGDVGYAAFISHKRDEAAARLVTIKKALDVIGVEYGPIDGGIVLREKNRGFKVFTASIAGVSGFTGILILCDEVSKWKDADTGVNPATEVLSSVRPTMATMPLARIILSSSPMGRLDAHAEAFDQGDTDFQFTAFAPTWIANPTLSEADTHALEPNEARWAREYAAIPMEGTDESLLSATLLDQCTREEATVLREPGVTYNAAMDPGFVRNAWTFAVAGRRWVAGRIKRSIVFWKEWRGTPAEPLDPAVVLYDIAGICRRYGIEAVDSDQYEQFSMVNIGARPGINIGVRIVTMSHTEQLAAYESLVTMAADRELDVPGDKQVRADLLGIRQKLSRNGFTIDLPTTPDGRHCDYAPTLLKAFVGCLHDPPDNRAAPGVSGTAAYYQKMADDYWEKQDEAIEKRATGAWWEAPASQGGVGFDE